MITPRIPSEKKKKKKKTTLQSPTYTQSHHSPPAVVTAAIRSDRIEDLDALTDKRIKKSEISVAVMAFFLFFE
jgi:hypothetical protein